MPMWRDEVGLAIELLGLEERGDQVQDGTKCDADGFRVDDETDRRRVCWGRRDCRREGGRRSSMLD